MRVGIERKITIELLTRMVDAREDEIRALAWSFAYFFFLICSYYILRPLRDEMMVFSGVRNLQWLFTATFLAMLVAVPLFGRLASKFSRRRIIPIVYRFFIVNILIYYGLMTAFPGEVWLARVFLSGQPVQSVRCVGVLELHGRSLEQRTGQAVVWFHRGGRQCGRYRGAGCHRIIGRITWSRDVVVDFRRFARVFGAVRSAAAPCRR